jgi:hypothetical protein
VISEISFGRRIEFAKENQTRNLGNCSLAGSVLRRQNIILFEYTILFECIVLYHLNVIEYAVIVDSDAVNVCQ